MPYVITEACVDIMDRSCVEQCPVDCIEAGERMMYINPDFCIDCGACEPACPQDAIYLDTSVPTELAQYTEINATAYESDEFGPDRGSDHPYVATLPKRSQ
jgi:NAD-dependent dihydropyrimidine dehydrogenase PreA subunit